MVVYADVLFIVNFFITFLLLQVTARLSKRTAKAWRQILASAVGGVYALVLLVTLPWYLSLLSKAAAAAVMLLIAFRYYSVKSFFLTLGIFLFANFLFLGIIAGICFLSKTPLIAINNQTVYFNVGTAGLLGCAGVAYGVSCLAVRLYNRRLADREVYTVTVENGGKSVSLRGLMDTGNRLREPFSGEPVIVADSSKLQGMYRADKLRLIPGSTVAGGAFLQAFRPERVTVMTAKGKEVSDNVYVALSDELHGEYSAILSPEILSI